MALRDDLLILAPEIPDNSRIDFFLTQAALRINRARWGSKADYATILLAAHELTRFNAASGPAVGGAVILEKVGDLQTQYAALSMKGDEEFSTTAYGATYAQMRKALGLSPLVIG